MSLFAPFKGAAYLGRGFSLITQSGLRRYVAIPLIINVLLFGGLIWFGADQFSHLIDSLLPQWLDWLHWLLWPLFALAILVAAFYTFAIVANFIASPFNSILSTRVELLLNSGQTAQPAKGMGVIESLTHEIKKLIFMLGWAIPLGVLFLIPGVNLIAPFAWLAFSAWMLSLEYCDYPMANHGIDFAEQRRLLRGKRFLSLGFGSAVLLVSSIPIVNLIALPAAVAGATALWREQLAETASKLENQ